MSAPHGISLTLRLLRSTPNAAGGAVLLEALRASEPATRQAAVRALSERRDPAAQTELLMSLGESPADVRAAACELEVAKRLRKMVLAALKSDDLALVKRASRYAIDADLFAALPVIVEKASDTEHPYSVGLATAAMQLSRAMASQLEKFARGERTNGDDPSFYRSAALSKLNEAAERFGDHGRIELIESLLLITTRDNAHLLRLLKREEHPCHDPLLRTLTASLSFGALDLLSQALLDSDAPSGLLPIAAERADKAFLMRLTEHVGYPIGVRARQNAQRVTDFAWADEAHQEVVLELPGEKQATLVELVVACGAGTAKRLAFVEFLLTHGDERGRTAACHLLKEFNEPRAAPLLAKALEDPAPSVIAAAARQLRSREIAGAEVVLIGLLEHPASEVRRAAQDELYELNVTAYREMFHKLSEPARRAAGRLVARGDAEAIPQVQADMQRPATRQRMEGLAMADAMGLVDKLATPLTEALSDKDACVRAEAARLLGASTVQQEQVLSALSEAADDENPSVRDAVDKSLTALRSLDAAERLVGELQDEFETPSDSGGTSR